MPAKPISKQKNEIIVPGHLKSALAANDKGAATFNEFSYSYEKEYDELITRAKTDNARNRRMGKAIKMLAEGKRLNDNYAIKK